MSPLRWTCKSTRTLAAELCKQGYVVSPSTVRGLLVTLGYSLQANRKKREGKQLCIDLIQEIREIEGVAGVHVMAYRQEELVSEIITASGIMRDRQPRLPRRAAKERTAS